MGQAKAELQPPTQRVVSVIDPEIALSDAELAAIHVAPGPSLIPERDRIMAEAHTPPSQKVDPLDPEQDAVDQMEEATTSTTLYLGC